MGSPPPPDLPPPTVGASASAGFAPGPPASSLCGFQFPPTFFFSFGFILNLNFPFSFPPELPFFSFGLNCSLNNPLDVTVGLPYGGGRASTMDADPDLYQEAA